MLELKKVRKSESQPCSVPFFTGIPLDNGKKRNGTEPNQNSQFHLGYWCSQLLMNVEECSQL